jgi:hypothetical protein
MQQNTKLIIAALGLGGLVFFLYKKGIFSGNTVESVKDDTNMNEEEYINYVIELAKKYGRQVLPSGTQMLTTEKKYINEKDKAILLDLKNSVKNGKITSAQREIIRRLNIEKITLD